MKNYREDQIKLHHQKWKRWKEQMKNSENKGQKKVEKPLQSTQTFAAKIIGKLQEDTGQKNKVASDNFKKQFENNSCTNCYQLMIPPRNPMTLFPCGHHMCRICLLGNNPKNTVKKIQKCSYCCLKIDNYTVNISLMNLICTYTNNTHLIQRQKQILQQQAEPAQDPSSEETISRLKLRCEILQKQKKAIIGSLAKQTKDKQILSEAINNLKTQKKKNNEQIQTAKKEAKLIDDFLNQKREQLEKIKSKISNAEQKKRVVEKALEPLKMQKQKLQILQVAKMVGKQGNK